MTNEQRSELESVAARLNSLYGLCDVVAQALDLSTGGDKAMVGAFHAIGNAGLSVGNLSNAAELHSPEPSRKRSGVLRPKRVSLLHPGGARLAASARPHRRGFFYLPVTRYSSSTISRRAASFAAATAAILRGSSADHWSPPVAMTAEDYAPMGYMGEAQALDAEAGAGA